MKLTQAQTERLYQFTKQHFVEWYDVQIELVDHLANGIEEQWESQPHLDFETALKIEFKKFGIFGFSELVEQKTNALDKHYRKQIFKHFITFLSLPKIIGTLFSIWFVNFLLLNIDNKLYVTVPFVGLVLVFPFIFLFKKQRQIKSRFKTTGKKWLFEHTLIQLGGLIHLLNIGFYFPTIFDSDREWTATTMLVFSVFIVVYILILYIGIYVVSPSIKVKASKDYPEYRLI